ncbi:MAG: hypothetical protein HYX61_07485 [Gammaproteobacteria bacterium]|jgi:hypothetical protein|nr:hypothetical protein [Gammaproteobacteria bacterium]
MANPDIKQDPIMHRTMAYAKVTAYFAEDVCRAILGFIPNGLNLTYDFLFKSLPLLGGFFSHRWAEQVIKLCMGITIGQGLAGDIAHFIFRPIGFVIGVMLGSVSNKIPNYQGQIGKLFYRLSAQTVSGALLGIIAMLSISQWLVPSLNVTLDNLAIATAIGAFLGLFTKGLLLIAVNTVHSANAATVRKNVQRAKDLNSKLKFASKQKAKSLILMQAQDIIQQMNGPQSQQYLEDFFNQEFEHIATSTYQKIERHFNYLTDRACHGDIKALKRLQELTPHAAASESNDKKPFEVMIERIFNSRAIFKLKDAVDTSYDRWQYRFLSVKEST